jgi:hypothetical protein
MAKRRSARAPEVDITEEASVLAEMAAALDEDPDALFVERDKNYESFGTGDVWRVEVGRQEYFVVADAVAADELAIEMVKQDLEQEPEIFNQDFIEQYIDEKKLAKALWSEVYDEQHDRLTDLDAKDFWEEAENWPDFFIPEEDDDGEQRDPTPEEINELADLETGNQLKDPMQYLENIHGSKEDARKQAIEIAGIDIDKAAKEAINADGAGQYLSSYDGELNETPGGFTYWRHN